MKKTIKDKGGRRSGQDRRTFYYAAYLPERRSGGERRTGEDRRLEFDIAYADEKRKLTHSESMAASM